MSDQYEFNEKLKLSKAVSDFADEMRDRLHEKVDEGFKGWQRPDKIHSYVSRLKEKAGLIKLNRWNDEETCKRIRKECVDIANLALMIHRLMELEEGKSSEAYKEESRRLQIELFREKTKRVCSKCKGEGKYSEPRSSLDRSFCIKCNGEGWIYTIAENHGKEFEKAWGEIKKLLSY